MRNKFTLLVTKIVLYINTTIVLLNLSSDHTHAQVQLTTDPMFTYYEPVQKTPTDSIPLHLYRSVNNPYQIMATPTWPYYPESNVYYWDQIQTPLIYDWSNYVVSFVWFAPACGDTYHDNGQLASRIDCVDSVLHGKAIYWDETGHKTQESTYSEGHQIKYKSYDDRGRLVTLDHYDYKGNRNGVCISYDYENNTKSVSRYDHGNYHGDQEEYVNGMLYSITTYNMNEQTHYQNFDTNGNLLLEEFMTNGIITERVEFAENGTKILHEKTSESGNREFTRYWDPEGILYHEEVFVNGVAQGEWLVAFHPHDSTRHTILYENGVKIHAMKKNNRQIFFEEQYSKGVLTSQIFFHENGDTSFYKEYNTDGITGHEKSWNTNDALQWDLKTENDSIHGLTLCENGSYSKNDTLYIYQAEEDPWQKIEIRFVVWQGDTLRQEYVENNTAVHDTKKVLCSNLYATHDGTFLPTGGWKFYNNNNLDSVITYQSGNRNGRAAYYYSVEDSVMLSSVGYYQNNLKSGTWSYTRPEEDLANLAGPELPSGVSGADSAAVSYTNDQRNGKFTLYSANGNILVDGIYSYDTPFGTWHYYDEQGNFIKEIEFKNGEPAKRKFEFLFGSKENKEKNNLALIN